MKRVKLEISHDDFFPKNRRGLSMIGSAVIIMALTIAIGVIVIIIYNIVSSEIEYSTEANVSLMIMKNSVVVDDKVSMTISRDLGNADLQKIRFVLSDGENTEEVEKDAKDLQELTQKDFSFAPKLVSNVKTIKIVPIVKVNGKLKYLSVQSSVEIKQKAGGGIAIEQAVFICGNAKVETGEECDDGNTISGDGCSAGCKTESCATQKGNICTSGKTCPNGKSSKSSDVGVCCKVACVSPTTGEENEGTTPTCGDGTCNATESCSSCVTDCGVCPVNCGNSIINSGEQCDAGASNGVVCSASYGQNCTYCSSSCINTTIQGARCGDGSCNGAETYATCSVDCTTGCGDGSCAATENCSTCPGDCGVCTKPNGQSCTSESECSSNVCAGSVCCNNACTTICKSCNITGSLGTCTNIPISTDPSSECSSITCIDYIYGWDGNSCKKYSTATSNNGMCNGAGTCYTSMSDSCTGVGTASASCGSAGCKKACVANSLATSYDSVSEVCYTSLQQSCQSGYVCDGSGTCHISLAVGSAVGFNWYKCDIHDGTCTQFCASHGGVASGNWNDNDNCDVCHHWYGATCAGSICFISEYVFFPPPNYHDGCYYRTEGNPCPDIRNSFGQRQFCACNSCDSGCFQL